MDEAIRRCEVVFEPEGNRIDVDEGTPLPEAAARAGIGIEQPCGGIGVCGQCRIRVPSGALPPGDEERRWFSAAELAEGWRLACRHAVGRDLTIDVPDDSRSRVQQILRGGAEREVALLPLVKAVVLDVPPPSLDDERGDWERLVAALAAAGDPVDPLPDAALLARIPLLLRSAGWRVRALLSGGRLIGLERGDVLDGPYGVAIDLGTTTQVAYLVDLAGGGDLAVAAGMNPQVRFGDDVIARIHNAGRPGGAAELQQAALEGLNALIAEACEKAHIASDRVACATLVGNTCMTHMLLGLPTSQLGEMPYVPVAQSAISLPAAQLGLSILPTGRVTVLPCIGGFVGADTVGVILAHLWQAESPARVAIDIGTNGEMVVQRGARRFACSAAAGPAFEGARIRDGMRGAPGAIAAVRIDADGVHCTTIENQPARGLCGSGLLDAAAQMLEAGVLDFGGRLAPPDKAERLPAALRERLSGEGNTREFCLVPANEAATGRAIALGQADIRELQLAKGSICAALLTLLAEAGLRPDEVEEVFLAGAFGSFLDIDSALRIGLLPPFRRERIRAVGNAAAVGAKLALLSAAELDRANATATRIRHLTLSTSPHYQMHFMEQMVFPME